MDSTPIRKKVGFIYDEDSRMIHVNYEFLEGQVRKDFAIEITLTNLDNDLSTVYESTIRIQDLREPETVL